MSNPNDCLACEGWTCNRCSPRLGEMADPEADELSRLRAELSTQRDGRARVLEANAHLLAENARLRTRIYALYGQHDNLCLEVAELKVERDSQATLATGYKRERDAAREEIKRAAAELRHTYKRQTDWRLVARAIEILERASQ